MAIIIQELGPKNRVKALHKFDALPVHIGRAYDNDLILGDPFVSPSHALIEAAETGWTIENLGSVNGVYLKNRRLNIENKEALHSGDVIVLGRTRLRLLDDKHQVLPAKRMTPAVDRIGGLKIPVWAWLLTVICGLLLCLDFFMNTGSADKGKELFDVLMLAVLGLGIILTWSGFWTFIGRILQNTTNFHYHLFLASGLTIFLLTIYKLLDLVIFNLNSPTLGEYISSIITALAVIALLVITLVICSNLSRKGLSAISLVLFLLFALIFAYSEFTERKRFHNTPRLNTTLIAPWARMVQGDSPDQFIRDSAGLFESFDSPIEAVTRHLNKNSSSHDR